MLALEVRGGEIIEHQAAGLQVARCQFFLDAVLAREEPVHRRIEIILIGIGDTELGRQRRLLPPADCCQLGVRRKDPRCQHGQDQVAPGIGLAGNELGHAQPLHCCHHRLDMAMGLRRDDRKGFGDGREPVAAQHGPDRLDLLCRQAGEVCKSAFFDLAVFAVGFTQEHGGWRATVWHDLDMHVYYMPYYQHGYKLISTYYMSTNKISQRRQPIEFTPVLRIIHPYQAGTSA